MQVQKPSPAQLMDILKGRLPQAPSAPEDDGSVTMSRNPDGSIDVPRLGFPTGPKATGRFGFELPLADRAKLPGVQAAIDGIGKLTNTTISTDAKTLGFHQGDIPVTGVVHGVKDDVLAAIDAITKVAKQAVGAD